MSDDFTGIGKALESVTELTKELRQFFIMLVGPAAEETGQFVADKIRHLRFKNGLRTLRKAQALLDEAGLDPRSISLKVLIPILEGCSLEDGDDLVAKWAGLLASAAAGDSIPPSYPNILSELTPAEARLLNLVTEWNQTISAAAAELAGPRPFSDDILLRTGLNGYEFLRRTGLTKAELCRVMFDLDIRHGLVTFYAQKWQPDLDTLWQMTLTPFGDDFVRVCRGPNTRTNT